MSTAKAKVRRFTEYDWDLTSQSSSSAFSDLHWHPCRFPSQLPAVILGRFAKKNDLAFDPFVGSGTSAYEAQKLGIDFVGFDINPISCLISQAKTLRYSASYVRSQIESHKKYVVTNLKNYSDSICPSTVQASKWYTDRTMQELCSLWNLLDDEFLEVSRSLLPLYHFCFSAVLMPACRETRHWGYICDNTTPKSDRERKVLSLYFTALDRVSSAYQLRERSASLSDLGKVKIVQTDSRRLIDHIAPRSATCFVTSPPYYGVADYAKSQRLSMEWFGFEIEKYRKSEIGARSKRHRKLAEQEYLTELYDVFAQAYIALKRGGWGVIVFGESPKRKSVKDEFSKNLEISGFKIMSDSSRQISEYRRQFPSLKNENILLVKKS